jgi:ubiquinone/menaquinone biosynthesis C-methylase UbiE
MPGTSADSTTDQQKLVDSYFHQEASYWEKIYDGTGVMELVHQERLRVILDLVDKFAPYRVSRVLDIGCGAGQAAVALAGRGHIVHAVDSVFEMVELTRNGAARAHLESRVRCARGDIHFLPFNDDTFNVIVAAGILPWVPSTERALKEMGRVLRPGGCLILSTDNLWGLCWFLDPLTNPLLKPLKERARNFVRRSGSPAHRVCVQMISVGECRRLLEANGLRMLTGTTLGFGPFSLFRREILPRAAGLRLHRQLQTLADRGYPLFRSAGAQYIVAAEKRAAFPQAARNGRMSESA